jgi:hypothetical protein
MADPSTSSGQQYKRKYRVLKDFQDNAGNEHKVDDEIELDPREAQAHVNASKITAALRSGE